MSEEKQPIDRLMDETRVLGASRMILDGTHPEKVTEADARQVIEALRRFLKEHPSLKEKSIARTLGIGASTLNQVLNLNYAGDWRSIIIDLDRWLDDEIKRQNAPKDSEFVLTKVAEEVMTVAEIAVTASTIGVVYGWAGIGKTRALQAVAAEKPGSIMISVRTAAASPLGVLQAIAAELPVRDYATYSQRSLTARIEGLLHHTSRLIIVDEIHKLCGTRDDAALHVLRDLYDATKVPMLWSGTTDLVAYLEQRQARGREPLGQIRRRIGICRDLTERTLDRNSGPGEPLYTVEEIRKVFAKSKMRLTPDGSRYLWMLANLRDCGGLGMAINLVRMATKVHEKNLEILNADALRSVHRLLVNRRAFTLLEARLTDEQSSQQRKVG